MYGGQNTNADIVRYSKLIERLLDVGFGYKEYPTMADRGMLLSVLASCKKEVSALSSLHFSVRRSLKSKFRWLTMLWIKTLRGNAYAWSEQ